MGKELIIKFLETAKTMNKYKYEKDGTIALYFKCPYTIIVPFRRFENDAEKAMQLSEKLILTIDENRNKVLIDIDEIIFIKF